jgi:hypothetical protein
VFFDADGDAAAAADLGGVQLLPASETRLAVAVLPALYCSASGCRIQAALSALPSLVNGPFSGASASVTRCRMLASWADQRDPARIRATWSIGFQWEHPVIAAAIVPPHAVTVEWGADQEGISYENRGLRADR